MSEARWGETRPPEDFYRVLDPDGTLRGKRPVASDVELLSWYRVLVETRVFEQLCIRMQRRGEVSVAASTLGEEAVGIGAAAALQAGDWCFPSYRQTSAFLLWNLPIDRMVAGLTGAPPEHINEQLPILDESPPLVHFVPYTVFLGASIPHAVGSAMADQLNARKTVTLAFVGDGATSEGDFYEGLNFAGVFKVPLVVIVQNNQWSISVPAHRQSAARTFAEKAVAVGLRHARVDGNDILAVYEKTKEAVDSARSGGGTTLIEAVTYRIGDHNTSDSADLYRGRQEVEYWQTLDPLERFERYMRALGLVNEDGKRTMMESASERFRAAIARARKLPPAPAALMFANHLIDRQGQSLRRQEAELADELGGRNPFASTDDGIF